ncbi:TonB-dependent receptor [Shewanella sp. NFH-SH190041]|uniref:TonB-dependent receptor domain-containing protein n=1 Tax=Shewanella sp. NFH-SH190041 TaxID=2950245 RepID=UPI0021C2E25E|nr:TonB-dependent receptor [Shewanella sp. NFH-SH190041]BDM63933.1 TonB-dependent receptor [Shewanella sp. NFH-SH190041]
MSSLTKISQAIRLSLCATAGMAIVFSDVSVAEEVGDKVERIEVTGSRIVREGAIAPTPVTVITGDDLLKTGAVNIAEALNELPQLANTDTLGNSGTSIGTAGLNRLDLRGMGTNRTLVLVDGKRHVAAVPGSAAMDINTIPTEWVESVEIITGGASAIYGADAVTGVVNFKLKQRINGFNASASSGWAEDSGYNNQRASLSYGSDFDDGRGNAAVSVEYAKQSNLGMMEREQTATSWTRFRNPTGETIYEYVPNGGHYRISNGGTTNIGGTWYTFNDNGSVREVNKGDKYNGAYCAGDCDYINLKQWEELQPEFDRLTVNFKANYDLTDDLNGYFEAKYSQTDATTSGQPAFFFFNGKSTLKRDNAFISDELGAIMDAAGEDTIQVNRFMTDMGPRIEDDTRKTQRYVFGIKGDVFDGWDLDGYALWGQTKHERTNHNNLIFKNFMQSIDAIKDDNGNIVCRDEDARANGCVATNLFGNGSVSAAARDYISKTTYGESTIEQFVSGFSMANSSLIELPAGYIGVATGIEYRHEKSDTYEDPSLVDENGDRTTFFNALSSEGGKFNVKEVFAEVSVPLLADLPLIQQLNIDGAVRYADYSSVGDATSWKLGLDWAMFDDLRIRSTVATAIRAPNIGELYDAQSQNFFRVKDSCKASRLADLEPGQRAIRAANCAALGIPVDFDDAYDSATLEGTSGGNPDLESEKSKSVTAGFVYEPGYLDNFVVMLDYWKIEIDDAIGSIAAQDIIDKCVDSPTGINNQYCALITRDKDSHQITDITQIVQNVAKSETSGIDLQVGYDFPIASGEFKTNILATYLLESKRYPFQDETSVYEEYAGVVGDAKWQAQLRIAYAIDNWNFNWKTTYLDRVDLYTEQFRDNYDIPYSNIMQYGSYAVTDILGTYTFNNGLAVGLGLDNVFDRDLPAFATGNDSGEGGYDNIGRFYYITLDFKM